MLTLQSEKEGSGPVIDAGELAQDAEVGDGEGGGTGRSPLKKRPSFLAKSGNSLMAGFGAVGAAAKSAGAAAAKSAKFATDSISQGVGVAVGGSTAVAADCGDEDALALAAMMSPLQFQTYDEDYSSSEHSSGSDSGSDSDNSSGSESDSGLEELLDSDSDASDYYNDFGESRSQTLTNATTIAGCPVFVHTADRVRLQISVPKTVVELELPSLINFVAKHYDDIPALRVFIETCKLFAVLYCTRLWDAALHLRLYYYYNTTVILCFVYCRYWCRHY